MTPLLTNKSGSRDITDKFLKKKNLEFNVQDQSLEPFIKFA